MGLRAVPKPRQALPSAKPTLGKQKQSFPTTQFGPIRDIAFAPLTFSAFTILNRFYIFKPLISLYTVGCQIKLSATAAQHLDTTSRTHIEMVNNHNTESAWPHATVENGVLQRKRKLYYCVHKLKLQLPLLTAEFC